MGVLGLTTFINNNSKRLLHDHLLCETSIVIDGNSLAVQLYQTVSQSNSAFGGDYDEYAKTVKTFFRYLSKCKINTYVVMDGGYEDRRMKTVLKRLRCRIIDASRMNPKNQSQYLVMPIMLKDVFIEVIISLGIKFTVCEYEADHEIAAVARYLKCPVLSYDSDFFIYNVIYIPFPTLSLKPVLLDGTDKEIKSFGLKCKVFKFDNFLKRFDLKEDHVPLIGTLLGNDYVQRSVFSKFYRNLRLPKLKSRNEGQCRITGVIEWLKNETLESSREKILSRFKITERNRINKLLNISCASYTRTNCAALKDLGFTEVSPFEDLHILSEIIDTLEDSDGSVDGSISDSSVVSEDSIREQNEVALNKEKPAWLLEILKRGEISARYFDLLHLSLYIGSSQIQDISKVDADMCALPIIRFACDIIFGFDKRKMFFEGRKNSSMKRIAVEFSGFTPDGFNTNSVSPPSSSLFFSFIEQSLDRNTITDISNLPNKCQLFVLTILWLKKTLPEISGPNVSHIYSLLMCFIMMSIIRAKTGLGNTYFHFNSKYSDKLEEWREISAQCPVVNTQGLLEKKVLYHDCMLAASKLLKYFEVDKKLLNSPKMFKHQYLHFFAQFQSCLQQFGYLNIMTSKPLTPCSISNTYNGTYIYNVYNNLRSRDNPGAYIYQLLKGSPTVLNYFISLADFVGYGIDIPENQDK